MLRTFDNNQQVSMLEEPNFILAVTIHYLAVVSDQFGDHGNGTEPISNLCLNRCRKLWLSQCCYLKKRDVFRNVKFIFATVALKVRRKQLVSMFAHLRHI